MPVAVFETPRLVVRSWTQPAVDVDFLFDMYSRWEVQRFLGAAPKVMQSRDDAVVAASRLSAYTADELFGSWAVTARDSAELLGTVLLKQLPLSAESQPLPLSDDVEVGWHLHPVAWGRGYATEAAEGALQRGFDAGLDEIYAVTYAENTASRAVCKRLGMADLGATGKYYGIECQLFRRSRREAPAVHR
jgi:RimJ/RimL family protein N-acetyltransferase